MPKIIENLRHSLLCEAKRQINERGYKNTTIRSVASGCGVAVGTVYNYFKSKDMLIASFVLDDWIGCLGRISEYPKDNKYRYLAFIHESICDFIKNNESLFYDKEAEHSFSLSAIKRHEQLRHQLAEQIMPIADDDFLAEYVAEALLCWTAKGCDFDSIYPLLPEKIK